MEFLVSSSSIAGYGVMVMILLSFSCSQPYEKNKQQAANNQVSKPPVIKKPPSSFDDTVIINSPSAVLYNPDSLQMTKIKSVNQTNVYATITHDCYFQMQNARKVIRENWPKVRIVEVIKARYLLFIKKDKNKICVDLNTRNDICGLFLFDPKKDPELADMPNIDTFLGFYFGQ